MPKQVFFSVIEANGRLGAMTYTAYAAGSRADAAPMLRGRLVIEGGTALAVLGDAGTAASDPTLPFASGSAADRERLHCGTGSDDRHASAWGQQHRRRPRFSRGGGHHRRCVFRCARHRFGHRSPRGHIDLDGRRPCWPDSTCGRGRTAGIGHSRRWNCREDAWSGQATEFGAGWRAVLGRIRHGADDVRPTHS